jgi:tRNA (cytidine/uridine-2'-O-)-methyltransferase
VSEANTAKFNLVLVNPQIPPNTGNIARTCAATQSPLHLVGPLGFDISHKAVKRAGLDYWDYVEMYYYESFETFEQQIAANARWIGFSKRGTVKYTDISFQDNDWLLFGSETQGLPDSVLKRCQFPVYIPMSTTHVRSLNLATAVAIGLYEARRQVGL